MSKPLKIVIAVAGVVVAAFVLLGIAVGILFKPAQYRPLVVDAIAKSTGRIFELDGELGLDLFPCCAVSLGAARLGNPAGFPEDAFARFASASASIAIWPLLLRREVEIGTVRVDGLEVNLVRLADGRGNWRFQGDPPAGESPVVTSPDEGRAGEPSSGLRMAAIDATRAHLRYRDVGSGREYAATDVHLRTGPALLHGALSVEAPEVTLTATGPTLPNGQVDLALTAERVVFTPGAGTLDIPGLALRLDDSNITGDFAVADTGMLGFDLKIDRLDVDRYLPRPPATATAPAAPAEPTPIPLDLIRRLNAVGNLRADELVLFRMRLAQVEASLRAEQGVLRIAPLAAGLYGGQYHGTVEVDATGPQAVVRLDQQLSGVQVGDVLKARYDSDRLVGALTASLTGTGSGATTRDVIATLAGNVNLDLANGFYRGTDFLYELRRAQAALKGKAPPPKPAQPETPIKALNMTGRLGNGVLHSDAINVEIPAARVAGKGDFDLLRTRLDYRLAAELIAAPDGTDLGGLQDLQGKSIPFTVEGPAADPRIRIDLEALFAGEAQNALQRGLRSLFGGKKN